MSSHMTVRMRDVAERAGVSTQTVSRVMRGEHWVAADTVSRVRRAMAELGYHGNEAAGALKRGQTRTLGLLFPLLATTFASFWPDVAAGAETLAHTHGYSVLLCDTSDSLEKEESYLSLLLRHRVAGIIYAQPRCRPDRHPACASLLASHIPVAVISSDEHDLPYTHVRTDDVRAGYVAARHLLDLGRQRIAFVGEAMTGSLAVDELLSKPAYDRAMGLRQAFVEANLDADASPLFLGPPSMEGGGYVGRALLSRPGPLPEAVFVATETMALGILDVLQEQGIRVPEDIAVVTHDGLLAAASAHPSLTTIAPPRVDMGRACIDVLLRAAAGEAPPPLCMLEAEFIVRESTVGIGRVPRQGVSAPLSAACAWSRWRAAPPLSDVAEGEGAPVARLTLGQIVGQEGG